MGSSGFTPYNPNSTWIPYGDWEEYGEDWALGMDRWSPYNDAQLLSEWASSLPQDATMDDYGEYDDFSYSDDFGGSAFEDYSDTELYGDSGGGGWASEDMPGGELTEDDFYSTYPGGYDENGDLLPGGELTEDDFYSTYPEGYDENGDLLPGGVLTEGDYWSSDLPAGGGSGASSSGRPAGGGSSSGSGFSFGGGGGGGAKPPTATQSKQTGSGIVINIGRGTTGSGMLAGYGAGSEYAAGSGILSGPVLALLIGGGALFLFRGKLAA